MTTLRSCLLAVVLAGLMVSAAVARDDFWPGGTYDEKIPTPESVLGYSLGAKHTPHFLMEQYIRAVDAASDRVFVEIIGHTEQGRAQYHIYISTPENLARIKDILADNHKLTVLDGSVSAAEIERIVGANPAIALLNYTVHGNEASGTEAALRTLYQLAAGTDETTAKILKEVVTVIDPVQNPDGHDRFVNYVNGYLVGAPNSDPSAYENSEPWPGGRMNAYYFDPNRDWFTLSQQVTRNRVSALVKLMPQVAPDLHEMGYNTSYFFHPPMLPVNWNVPAVSEKWLEIYGLANAEAFDAFGWPYFTRESFDMLYPGYGESLPAMLGAIGMTYEQANARAGAIERNDGSILTLKKAVAAHFTTSMATLTVTANRRAEKLRDFHSFFVEHTKKAAEGFAEVYLPPGDPGRMNRLVHRLQMLGARVYTATVSFSVKGAYDYFAGKKADVTLPAGTVIVPIHQTPGIALKSILEPESKLSEEFLKEERRRLDRGEESRFYDVTAWSMPLTYGLQAYSVATAGSGPRELLPPVTDEKPAVKPVSRARVAYLITPDVNANIALVGRLLQNDFKVRVATEKFSLGGINYPTGTAVLLVDRNPESLHTAINEYIAETGGTAIAAASGYTPEGVDLGSSSIAPVRAPKIALMADSPISSYNFGEIRHSFEQLYGVKYTAFRAGDFGRFRLEKYNVLIIPDSWGAGALKGILGKGGIARLQAWVRAGGVIIAIGSSVNFLADEEVKLTDAIAYTQKEKKVGEVEPAYGSETKPAEPAKEEKKAGGDKEKFEVEKLVYVPGAILRARFDDRAFLSWGYERGWAPVLVEGDAVWAPISEDQGMAAARFYAEKELVVSGHIWEESRKLLAGTAYAWYQPVGGGLVVCFSQDPIYRAAYDGLERLFYNAVFFSGAFVRQ